MVITSGIRSNVFVSSCVLCLFLVFLLKFVELQNILHGMHVRDKGKMTGLYLALWVGLLNKTL